MNRSRTASVIATSVLVLGAVLAAGGPATAATAAKKKQTIQFTSVAPSVKYDDDGFYLATAKASSKLPVTIKVASASASVCFASAGPGGTAVNWRAPGTCTLHAAQAGNKKYAAAKATQSFVVDKEVTSLSAARVSKGFFGLTSSTFSATLEHTTRFGPSFGSGPFADQTVTFTVDGTVMCTGTTDSSGVATCDHTLGYAIASTDDSYTATFDGTPTDDAATATGVLG